MRRNWSILVANCSAPSENLPGRLKGQRGGNQILCRIVEMAQFPSLLDIPLTVKNLAGQCPHPDALTTFTHNRDTLSAFWQRGFGCENDDLVRRFALQEFSNDLQLMTMPGSQTFSMPPPANGQPPPQDSRKSSLSYRVALKKSQSTSWSLEEFLRVLKAEVISSLARSVNNSKRDEFASLSSASCRAYRCSSG